MPFNFCANLSTMYKNAPFEKRLYEAKKMGFKNVEAQFLYPYELSQLSVAREDTGLEFVLINSPYKGKISHPEEPFGLACIPGHDIEFMKTMNMAVQYAKELQCHKIHVIAGKKLSTTHYSDEEYREAYIKNILIAADYLEENNMLLLIEPMSTPDDYFLKSFDQAVSIIEEVNCFNVKMLLDVYHMHGMGMNVEESIPKYLKHTGHIQVSQSPKRHEPFYPGEINYEKVFEILEEKYTGDIGLEYSPSELPNSHDWFKKYLSA